MQIVFNKYYDATEYKTSVISVEDNRTIEQVNNIIQETIAKECWAYRIVSPK